ncbi:MAG: GNAT family N-acetyltransferase [Butyricicoccus porcorum]|nr:GNAT family N-acetyltransferase [Butyricicoccus porcorum]MDD6987078.1 GNAT family N-acetyltransferase [Butyricicoccus porcorum]
MELTFQQVTDTEIETLAALADEIWHEFFPGIISDAQVDYMVEKFQSAPAMRQQIAEGYRYYLVYTGAELIGYTGVHPEEELLFLSKLYLKKQHRGHGYGRKMIEFVAGLARELGKSGVYLTVNRYNENTIAVYHATGFETVRTQVADIGNGYVMDDYVMQLAV